MICSGDTGHNASLQLQRLRAKAQGPSPEAWDRADRAPRRLEGLAPSGNPLWLVAATRRGSLPATGSGAPASPPVPETPAQSCTQPLQFPHCTLSHSHRRQQGLSSAWAVPCPCPDAPKLLSALLSPRQQPCTVQGRMGVLEELGMQPSASKCARTQPHARTHPAPQSPLPPQPSPAPPLHGETQLGWRRVCQPAAAGRS